MAAMNRFHQLLSISGWFHLSIVHVTYTVIKCAHMRFTEFILFSFVVIILHLYVLIDYTRHSSCRQVIRVPHGEIACNYFMYNSFFRRYIDIFHTHYFIHTYALTHTTCARAHTHTYTHAHTHTHTRTHTIICTLLIHQYQ